MVMDYTTTHTAIASKGYHKSELYCIYTHMYLWARVNQTVHLVWEDLCKEQRQKCTLNILTRWWKYICIQYPRHALLPWKLWQTIHKTNHCFVRYSSELSLIQPTLDVALFTRSACIYAHPQTVTSVTPRRSAVKGLLPLSSAKKQPTVGLKVNPEMATSMILSSKRIHTVSSWVVRCIIM